MKKNEIIEYFIVFLIFVCIICFGIGYLRNKLYTKPANSNQINEVPSKDNLVDDENIDINVKYSDLYYNNINSVIKYTASTDINSDFIKEMYSIIPNNSFAKNEYTNLPNNEKENVSKNSIYQDKIVTVSDINKYTLLNSTIKEIIMKYYRYLSLNENVNGQIFYEATGSDAISLENIKFSAIKDTYKEIFNIDFDNSILNGEIYMCIDDIIPGGYSFSLEFSDEEQLTGSDQATLANEVLNNTGLTRAEFDDVNKEYYLYNKNNNKEYKHTFKLRDDNSYYYVSTQPVK